jgi:hemolysin activation/secretion protein
MFSLKPVSSAALVAALGLVVSSVWAQPNIGNVLQQVPSPSAVERQQAPLPTIRGQEIRAPLRELPAGTPTVTVREFRFAGNREVDAAALQAQVAADIGKPLNFAELEELTTRLTRYYRSLGYFVARVYLPEQEITDGVITLQAVEGNYGKFILDNKSLVRDDIVQGMLDDVKKYDIVSLDTLERAMLIINDTPGSQVIRADVMPGQAVGTSDFAVGTVADPTHQGSVLVDNHGTRATGRDRINANWDWNSPSGRGDRLSVSGLASFKGDLINGRVDYSGVLSYSGWRGQVAASRTEYSLGDQFAALDAVGVANSYELGVTYPIRRIRAQTIQFGLNSAHKNMKD